MDGRGPQYWRNINNFAALVSAAGVLFFVWGTQQISAHHDDPPSASSPSDVCTVGGKPMPCSILPNGGIGDTDAGGRPVRQVDNGAAAGSGLVIFGLLLFVGGLIPAMVAGANLRRIRYQVMDYTYEQMQSQQGQSRNGVEIPCPFCGQMNNSTNQFCGKCGKPLSTT